MILLAAERILVEEGFSALTIRKIAIQIGYTVGSIYMVFENRADLVLHINAITLDHIAMQLGEIKRCTDASDMDVLAKAYLNYAKHNLNRWRLVFDYHLPEGKPIPEWYQAKIDAIFRVVEVRFAQLSRNHTDAENKKAVRILCAAVHGVCVLPLSNTFGKIDFDAIEDGVVLLTRNFMRGWMTSN